MSQLDRIERKLDQIDAKLDNHTERIAKAEVSIIWIKWAISVAFSVTGAIGLATLNFIENRFKS